MKYRTCVGIDTHKKKNEVCALDAGTGEVRRATLPADPARLVRWLEGAAGSPEGTMCVYEAGPTGFGLARALGAAGWPCQVAATSKLPRRTDAMKTDRIDAEWLARCLATGVTRAVRVPTEAEEALRHLSALRGRAAAQLRAARQRVASFLLLTGTRYTETKKRWTKAFGRWCESHEMPQAADTYVLRDLYREEEHERSRLQAIEAELLRLVAAGPALSETVARLECLPRVGGVTAVSLACEVYDFSRFPSGRAFASWLGLTPSESSTGSRTRRGGIDKRGNANLRGLLVEAASGLGAASAPVRVAAPEGAPGAAVERGRACAERLRRRSLALRARGVPANKAKVAVARELAEWAWHVATMRC